MWRFLHRRAQEQSSKYANLYYSRKGWNNQYGLYSTRILQDILDIDNRIHISAKEVKNCFSKYSVMVMKANKMFLIQLVRHRENNKGSKLNYVPTFMQLLEDNFKEIKNTISERTVTRNLIAVQNAQIRLHHRDL